MLVTNNRHSMPSHLADHLAGGRHVPGILLIDQSMTAAELANELAAHCRRSWQAWVEFCDIIKNLPVL